MKDFTLRKDGSKRTTIRLTFHPSVEQVVNAVIHSSAVQYDVTGWREDWEIREKLTKKRIEKAVRDEYEEMGKRAGDYPDGASNALVNEVKKRVKEKLNI